MSEESLMDTPAPEEDTQAPETTETTETPEWFMSEGVKGEGDPPEWYMADKYKTVAEQAKAYPELSKKFGAFEGAPEEYVVSFPEDDEGNPLGEFIDGDPMLQQYQEIAKDMGMSQEGFSKLLHSYVKWNIDAREATRAAEVEKLGDRRDARIKDISDWGQANLSEEMFQALKNTLVSADAFNVAEYFIAMTREKQIPGDTVAAPSISEAELQARVSDPRYATNEAGFRDETEALFRKRYGVGEHAEVRQ